MAYHKPRTEATKTPEGIPKFIRTLCNSNLFNQLIDIKDERRSNLSDTVRLLLYLGIEQYHINKATGADTRAKRKDSAAKNKAEAQAIAARREAEKQRKAGKGKPSTAPAVTSILFKPDKED